MCHQSAPYHSLFANTDLVGREAKRAANQQARERSRGAERVLAALNAARPATVLDCYNVVNRVLNELTAEEDGTVQALNPKLAADFAAAVELQRQSLSQQSR